MKEKVAVLFGGNSFEREISIKSGKEVEKVLKKYGIETYLVDTKYSPVRKLRNMNFSKAFIMLHGKNGEDGIVQRALETLNIPYTGSGVFTSFISFNKINTKKFLKSIGLPVIPYLIFQKSKIKSLKYKLLSYIIRDFKFPVVVKPNCCGSSLGISVVNSLGSLKKAIKKAFLYDDNILLEKYLFGLEYSVSILDGEKLPSIRIETDQKFYNFHAKYFSNKTRYICPGGMNLNEENELRKLSMFVYKSAKCSNFARIDLIKDINDVFYILEINTIPGMTRKSLFPMSAKRVGIGFSKLVLKILKNC
ncbi:hypothetical protein AOQ88_01810 [Candidatus Riesia sp. GBBU]|nr:hypothetical protein AOQ88_01810 [Candidatus Riesia sp. GBBU]